MKHSNTLLTLIAFTLLFVSCQDDGGEEPDDIIEIYPGPDAEQQIQTAFIEVEDGGTIRLFTGNYDITGTLTMDDKHGVTIQGQGGTLLNFASQADGGEGIQISNSSDITINSLEIRDTDGDALKVRETEILVIDDVAVAWTGDPSSENGAYGIYPVLCYAVIVRNSAVRGASDAGIYVGQSQRAQVYNNTVRDNVSGIEIENTIDADVFDNLVNNNTGGILVFDLPIPGAQSGSGIRVFQNNVADNNHDNFAPAGGIVSEVPPGTGILVMAAKAVEVFDNTVSENQIVGVAVFSYVSIAMLTGRTIPDDFNPYFDQIYILNNEISRSGSPNPNQTGMGLFLLNEFGESPMPDMMTDGIFSSEAGDNGGLCIQENSTEYFINLDLGNPDPSPSLDLNSHNCSFERLPQVEVVGE